MTPSFSPLFLNYSNQDESRKWSIDFQSKPTARVQLIGHVPTRDELITLLGNTNLPISWLEAFEVLVTHVARERADRALALSALEYAHVHMGEPGSYDRQKAIDALRAAGPAA